MAKKKEEAEEGVSDRKPQTQVGGVTPTVFKQTCKSVNTIDNELATARGDKAAALEKFKDAGGDKKALKRALDVERMGPDVAVDHLHNFFEYLKALGVLEDFEFKMAQGELFEGKSEGGDDEEEEEKTPEKPKEDVGKAQAAAFQAAHH